MLLEFQERAKWEEEWWSSVAERGLRMGNTYFEHKSLHKYTRMPRGQDEVEIKSTIDLVLVKKDLLRYV